MLYESLTHKHSSIRLLEILPPTDENDPVSCYLRTVALDTDKIYTALSYRWDNTSNAIISVNDIATRVGKNLALALQHIRNSIHQGSSSLCSLIWVDAVCINQDDEDEKSHQIQLMGAIYSRASSVISWLGPDNNGEMASAIIAIQSIEYVVESTPDWLKDLEWMQDYPLLREVDHNIEDIPNKAWKSLEIFFSAPYWGRVWVLQEMALARNLWVMVGNDVLDYKSVKHFIQLIRRLSSESAPRAGLPYELSYHLRTERIPTELHLIVHDFREHFETSEKMSDGAKLEAIFCAWPYRATDPRDKIFALQGLLGNVIIPDYSKSTSEVYSGLMSKWIANTGDLDLLRYAGAALHLPEEPELSLPSWTPNWQGISLVDSWQPFPARPFQSDYGLTMFCPSPARALDERCLRVYGCICDTISEIEPSFDLKVNCLSFYRNCIKKRPDTEYPTKIPYLQAILRTILRDTYSQNQDPTLALNSLLGQSLLLATVYRILGLGQPIIDTLRSCIEELGIASENHITSFLRKVLPSAKIYDCWESEREVTLQIAHHMPFVGPHLLRCFNNEHRFFHTSTGYIGSGPEGIQAGDMIGVIQGCPCPVMLRRQGPHYIHLGTCFVLGFMDGEVALHVGQGSMKIQELDII